MVGWFSVRKWSRKTTLTMHCFDTLIYVPLC